MSPQTRIRRILVAGVGNIFLGDDAFGVEVAQRLLCRPMPEGVCVVDFGIRGLDLAFALLDGYEAVILVDAMPRGGAPGTVYVLEPELATPATNQPVAATLETHNMDPVRVLQTATALGAPLRRVIIVGCEPEACENGNFAAEMSDPARSAVHEAIRTIEALVAQFLDGEGAMNAVIGKGIGDVR